MSSEYVEVRSMISTVARRLDCKGAMTGHQIKNALRSLRSLRSDRKEVLELLDALAKKISNNSDSTFDVTVRIRHVISFFCSTDFFCDRTCQRRYSGCKDSAVSTRKCALSRKR
jgi:hypothetical protein